MRFALQFYGAVTAGALAAVLIAVGSVAVFKPRADEPEVPRWAGVLSCFFGVGLLAASIEVWS